jgi:Cu(I)/Ag(I) efflux system membrane fusion protein
MQWIRTGSKVDFTVQSLPGEKFTARITFVDPIMDPKSRVSKARAEMTNSSNKFKPEMFVTGKVTSELKKGSEITLPKSAIMWTGERSIVYLKKTSNEGVSFRLQEVVLGPSLGESYVIEAGLEPGMEVVVNGTFTIDAAAQLSGKPSMMNADFRKMKSNESISSAEFNSQLRLLLPSYLKLKDALVETNADAAATEAKQFSMSLAKIDASSLDGKSIHIWNPLFNKMLNSAKESSSNNDVEQQRKHLGQITDAYYEAITQFNLTGLNAYYQYCPMAFHDAGAYWISKEKEIRNPYFGSKMIRCGETREELN